MFDVKKPDRLEGRYRHEIKYEISYGEYLILKNRIRTVMKRDSHTDADGRYLVQSIYFDNYRDKAVREKKYGLLKREKFRIRYYNEDLSRIRLEKKMKNNGLCMKLSAPLSEEECRKILAGDRGWMKEHDHPLIREFYAKTEQQILRPKVKVSYLREPYTYKIGNVRITFDTQIRSSVYSGKYLEPETIGVTTEDRQSRVIMELKYDDFIPKLISDMVQMGTFRNRAFSKYVECRKFG